MNNKEFEAKIQEWISDYKDMTLKYKRAAKNVVVGNNILSWEEDMSDYFSDGSTFTYTIYFDPENFERAFFRCRHVEKFEDRKMIVESEEDVWAVDIIENNYDIDGEINWFINSEKYRIDFC